MITKISSCHCGSIELELTLNDMLENIRRCDCSMCSRKGYVMASVPIANLNVCLIYLLCMYSSYRLLSL